MSTITRSIKSKLDKYGVNLPVDKCTRAYANIIKKNQQTDTKHISYFKDTLEKYVTKEKKIVAQVASNKVREQVISEVQKKNTLSKFEKKNSFPISKIQRNYLRNKLFYSKPSHSSLKSYFDFHLDNTRPKLVSMPSLEPEFVFNRMGFNPEYKPPTISVQKLQMSDKTRPELVSMPSLEPEFVFNRTGFNPAYTPPNISVQESKKFIRFQNFQKFLMRKIGHKVFISAKFITLFDGNIEGKGIISSLVKSYTKSDVNTLLTSFFVLITSFMSWDTTTLSI